MSTRLFLWLGVALGAGARLLVAQTAALSGVITSDSAGRQPISGVEVFIPAASLGTRTNFRGEYRIPGLALGKYLVTVRAIGFVSINDTVSLTAAGEIPKDYVLARPVLDTMKVVGQGERRLSASMSQFERRRSAGLGHFVTTDELRKDGDRRLSELLVSRVPGLRLVNYQGRLYASVARNPDVRLTKDPSAQLPRALPTDRGSPRGCWVQVYLNGARIYVPTMGDGTNDAPNMLEYAASDLEAIEFYSGPATTPPELNASGSMCGTLVLWAREK